MWKCLKCGRIFNREGQVHSCRVFPFEEHFVGKDKARKLFDYLLTVIEKDIGKCEIISLPCCIHLFGKYDFLAALPKKGKLEVRFALDEPLKKKRIMQTVQMSSNVYKNCLDVLNKNDINKEFINWLKKSYHLKDKYF